MNTSLPQTFLSIVGLILGLFASRLTVAAPLISNAAQVDSLINGLVQTHPNFVGSAIQGQGASFFEASLYDVDPRLLLAVAAHETIFGTACCTACRTTPAPPFFNVFNSFYGCLHCSTAPSCTCLGGCPCNSCMESPFAGWDDAVAYVGDWFASKLTKVKTIDEIQYSDNIVYHYCPVECCKCDLSSDPTACKKVPGKSCINTSCGDSHYTDCEFWAKRVASFYHDALGGDLCDLSYKGDKAVTTGRCALGVMPPPPPPPPPPTTPTLTFSANPTSVANGGSSTLNWDTTGASGCVASGAWGGGKAARGAQTVANLTTDRTYTLTCTGAGGIAMQTVSVTVLAPGGCVLSAIHLGETQSGTLTPDDCDSTQLSGRKVDRYSLQVNDGDYLSVRAQSPSFQAFIYIIAPDGGVRVANSGCVGSSGTEACSYDNLFTPVGTYSIEVTSFEAGALGSYTLEVGARTPRCAYQISPVSPPPVDFGATTGCLTKTFMVSGEAGCWVQLAGQASASPPFSVPVNDPGNDNRLINLGANGHDTVEVSFCPSSPGTYSGTATFPYGGYPGRPPVTVALSGSR